MSRAQGGGVKGAWRPLGFTLGTAAATGNHAGIDGRERRDLCRKLHHLLLFVFSEQLHIQVTMRLNPIFVYLDR